MSYILDHSKLSFGDIILLRDKTKREHQLIIKQSDSKYAHALLYVSSGSCLESEGDGVNSLNSGYLIFSNKDDAMVYRLKKSDPIIITKAINWARSKVGTEYSTSEARAALDKNKTKKHDVSNRQYCVRLVTEAYYYAGVKIVENPFYPTPKDIETSKELTCINDILIEATPEDEAFANNSNTVLPEQRNVNLTIHDALNQSFKGKDLQTLEQVVDFLIANKDEDSLICDIYSKAGYFTLWEIEKKENPWLYDVDSFIRHYNSNCEKTAIEILTQSDELKCRYSHMLSCFQELDSQYKLDFFKMQKELYEKLLELNTSRIDVAEKVICNFCANMSHNDL